VCTYLRDFFFSLYRITALSLLAAANKEHSGPVGYHGGSPMRSTDDISGWSPALLSPVKPEQDRDRLERACLAGKDTLGSALVPGFDIRESTDAALLHAGCMDFTLPADDA